MTLCLMVPATVSSLWSRHFWMSRWQTWSSSTKSASTFVPNSRRKVLCSNTPNRMRIPSLSHLSPVALVEPLDDVERLANAEQHPHNVRLPGEPGNTLLWPCSPTCAGPEGLHIEQKAPKDGRMAEKLIFAREFHSARWSAMPGEDR